MKLQTIALLLTLGTAAFGQSATEETPRASIAVEADALAYGLPGYSGIVNLSLRNGFQIAFGTGRYEVPGFLLKGDDNYDAVGWKATSKSVQVLRVTYRFNGPMKSGPALGAVLLNQSWRLRAEKLSGETTFRPLSVGITGGYYIHVGKHFYIYPTAAFTHNSVVSGRTSLQGTNYDVAKWGPNASVHVGWEWGL
ncbi:MAG: hypothetical protein ABIR70_18340 [Bryobacteraceae bacterium]